MKIKAYALISEYGIQYDANGTSLALAIYPNKKSIGARKNLMVDGDKIVEVLISSPVPKKNKKIT